MASILPVAKTINTSRFSLYANSFDATNNAALASETKGQNLTLSTDTPKGVLGGMVAVLNAGASPSSTSGTDWQVGIGTTLAWTSQSTVANGRITITDNAAPTLPSVGSAQGWPVGLFGGNSEGNAFENAPSAASGIVSVYLAPAVFEIYVFETCYAGSTTSCLSQTGISPYTIGCPLFCSPYGLLTPEMPIYGEATLSAKISGYYAVDVPIAICCKVPTTTDMMLGVILLPPTPVQYLGYPGIGH